MSNKYQVTSLLLAKLICLLCLKIALGFVYDVHNWNDDGLAVGSCPSCRLISKDSPADRFRQAWACWRSPIDSSGPRNHSADRSASGFGSGYSAVVFDGDLFVRYLWRSVTDRNSFLGRDWLVDWSRDWGHWCQGFGSCKHSALS